MLVPSPRAPLPHSVAAPWSTISKQAAFFRRDRAREGGEEGGKGKGTLRGRSHACCPSARASEPHVTQWMAEHGMMTAQGAPNTTALYAYYEARMLQMLRPATVRRTTPLAAHLALLYYNCTDAAAMPARLSCHLCRS